MPVHGARPEVAQACQEWLPSVKLGDARVFYVCGSDHAFRCGIDTGFYHHSSPDERIGLVIVPRSGEKPREDQPEDLVYWAEPPDEVQDYSSTKVREALLPGGDAAAAERMLGSAAVAYIRARGLYGAAPDAPPVRPAEIFVKNICRIFQDLPELRIVQKYQ